MNELNETDTSFSALNDYNFIDLISYCNDKLDEKKKHNISIFTIKFIKDSQRFDEHLL